MAQIAEDALPHLTGCHRKNVAQSGVDEADAHKVDNIQFEYIEIKYSQTR